VKKSSNPGTRKVALTADFRQQFGKKTVQGLFILENRAILPFTFYFTATWKGC